MIEIASDEVGIYQKFHGKAVLELEQQGIKEERYKDMVSELRKEVRDEIYNSLNEARLGKPTSKAAIFRIQSNLFTSKLLFV